jgi:hypothetical protein
MKMESRIDALLAQEGLGDPNANQPNFLETPPETINNEAAQDLTPEPTPEPETLTSEPDVSRETINKEPEPEVTPEPQLDDYGNEVPQENAAIRERLSKQAKRYEQEMARMRQEMEDLKAAQQQPQNQTTPDIQEGDWEVQLEQFIDQRLTAREQQVKEAEWRRTQQQQQAQFEIKFNEGASKYGDFESVVMGKAITAEMILATQDMADPAAFIYAAAKTQATELDRISRIPNKFTQAMEMGKLEERMRKARTTTTSAPKPIERPKGDAPDSKLQGGQKDWSIDEKIRFDERQRMKARG